MSDPIIPALAGPVVAGAGASVLSYLGLEPAPLFWALVGASLGMTFAAATGRARAATVFAAVVLVCSLFGAWLAQRYMAGESISRNAFSCVLAIVFHPALQAIVTRIPLLFDSIVKKWFGAQQ